MKRIGIDARLLHQTGVGRYTRNVLLHLEKYLADDEELYVYMLGEDIATFSTKHPRIHLRKTTFMWHTFSEQFGFCLQLYRDSLDLMHFTYFSLPILYRKPFVITIHDLIPLKNTTGTASTKHPIIYSIKYAGYRTALRAGVNNSQVIITPSQTVKNDILANFPAIPENKIVVTYEGVGSDLLKCKPDKKAPFKKPYFMYVGNFYPHKNVLRMIEAFALIKEDVQLILVGPEDYFAGIVRAAIHEHGQEERILMFHGITDKELVTYYAHAKALVHPSLDEGFGLQLLEASYFGCPVIASDIPLFHETLGENFSPFDPKDVYDIASKITDCLQHKAPKVLTQNAIEKRFSFEHMAHQTYDIYQSILTKTAV